MNINLTADKHIVKVGSATETLKLTATATDINGNPITNQSLTLLKDGETVSSTTTDNNGEAVWQITIEYGGIYDFSVNDEHTTVSTYGFEHIKSNTGNRYHLYAYKGRKIAMLVVDFVEINISSIDNDFEVVSFVPAEYRPFSNIFSLIARNNNVILYIWASGGTVGIANKSSSTITGFSTNTMIQWSYE